MFVIVKWIIVFDGEADEGSEDAVSTKPTVWAVKGPNGVLKLNPFLEMRPAHSDPQRTTATPTPWQTRLEPQVCFHFFNYTNAYLVSD